MDRNTPTEQFRPDRWVLTRNGKMTGSSWKTTEADAWAQAPTLEKLIPKLIESMRGVEFAELCISFTHDGRYDLVLFNSGEAIYAIKNTLAEAVAAIFVAACEDKLIDGKAVTL